MEGRKIKMSEGRKRKKKAILVNAGIEPATFPASF